jgi:hypothetical protein
MRLAHWLSTPPLPAAARQGDGAWEPKPPAFKRGPDGSSLHGLPLPLPAWAQGSLGAAPDGDEKALEVSAVVATEWAVSDASAPSAAAPVSKVRGRRVGDLKPGAHMCSPRYPCMQLRCGPPQDTVVIVPGQSRLLKRKPSASDAGALDASPSPSPKPESPVRRLQRAPSKAPPRIKQEPGARSAVAVRPAAPAPSRSGPKLEAAVLDPSVSRSLVPATSSRADEAPDEGPSRPPSTSGQAEECVVWMPGAAFPRSRAQRRSARRPSASCVQLASWLMAAPSSEPVDGADGLSGRDPHLQLGTAEGRAAAGPRRAALRAAAPEAGAPGHAAEELAEGAGTSVTLQSRRTGRRVRGALPASADAEPEPASDAARGVAGFSAWAWDCEPLAVVLGCAAGTDDNDALAASGRLPKSRRKGAYVPRGIAGI